MGFLRRLLGRPGRDEDEDAVLVAPSPAQPGAARPEPIIIRSGMTIPPPEPREFISRTYAAEPEPSVPAELDPGSLDGQSAASASPAVDADRQTDSDDAWLGIPDLTEEGALPDDATRSDEIAVATGSDAPATGIRCPSCTVLLDPPPERTRRCPYCREQIVVRRVDGRPVYLTEAALPIFDQERQRTADTETWTEQRQHWLRLAGSVRAPAVRRARLAAAPLTAAVVQASRTLYLTGAELAVRAARNEKRWQDVGRIRREQAAALWAEEGGKIPPPPAVVDLHEEGMLAELRSMTRSSRDAELISARCCKTCRADDGKAFRISAELKVPRLPHAGCPKGICKCEWWPTMSDPHPKSRRRSEPTAASGPAPHDGSPEEGTSDETATPAMTATPALTATRAETPDVSVVFEVTQSEH